MSQQLLISSANDHSTSDVMDWLAYLGGMPLRLPAESLDTVDWNNISAVWFRRMGDFQLNGTEWRDKIVLGHPNRMKVDKLMVLNLAQSLGLHTPDSLLTESKAMLLDFYEKHQGRVITKLLDEHSPEIREDGVYLAYTERVPQALLAELPDSFAPSFFQNELSKAFELRVFYLNGICYAMAQFTQAATDSRRYAATQRKVPYQLPPTLCAQIKTLMDTLELNTGSLDFIETPTGETVFLEINPVGQFGFVSKACNYRLEEQIARYLLGL